MEENFDVIVVGAGHAGIEACLASARLGQKTLMVTTNLDRIGFMSCNPAIGGLAKGHMVREIDALGGEMGRATDTNCIQFKRLNSKKGPAVRGSRAQCDKDLYVKYMTQVLQKQSNLTLLKSEVKSLILNKDICSGVVLEDGSRVNGKAVILTTGTFMNGLMHVGNQKISGGRVGDKATTGLSQQLKVLGFQVHRLKTGTPPRLIAESINFSKTQIESGDEVFYPFGFRSETKLKLPQINCYLTYTNEKTHEILQKNIHKSPIFSGSIESYGPRYCPSIEDKITRFADKNRHQTFLEPEGLSTNHIYLQGISTSLPADVQDEFVKTIPGLENVEFARYGYAIEYDFFEPTQIHHTLETRGIPNLYLAGQINGTSGYEEAAAQGLVAGINASLKNQGREPLVLGRDQAYIGVLIDDLVTKGTQEPYRMFTSRAEYRLALREDNTIDRLIHIGHEVGLISDEEYSTINAMHEKRNAVAETISKTFIYPNEETNKKLISLGTAEISKPTTLAVLLRRNEVSFKSLLEFTDLELEDRLSEPLEISIKYEGYIKRQDEIIKQARRLEKYGLDASVDYKQIKGLSVEEIEKLTLIKPKTLGQAQRISGVNPSAIQAILVYLKGQNKISAINNE